jgi:hypothetical protein
MDSLEPEFILGSTNVKKKVNKTLLYFCRHNYFFKLYSLKEKASQKEEKEENFGS